MPPRRVTRAQMQRAALEEREEQERVEREHARLASPFRSGATPSINLDDAPNANRPQNNAGRREPSPSLTSISALQEETRQLLGRATDDQRDAFRGLWRRINASFARRLDNEPDEEQDGEDANVSDRGGK